MANYAGNALFGRKYRLIIGKKGESGLDTSELHCSFTVEKSMSSRPNYSTLKIYNLAPDTQNSILSEGSRIIIEAGYEGPQYGLIYDGDIVQTLCYVEDGISSVTEILSQDGDVFLNKGFISVSYSAGETASSLFSGLAGQGDPDMALGEVSGSLSGTKLARGKAMFGKPGDYAQKIARGQGGLFFINDRKVNLVRPEDLPAGEIVSLSPDSGLIGAPEQTENGIKAKCLLNPLLNLNKLVTLITVWSSSKLAAWGKRLHNHWEPAFTGLLL